MLGYFDRDLGNGYKWVCSELPRDWKIRSELMSK